jgi:hypothetical protein
MEIAGLLVVLAVVGGLVVAPIVLHDTSWTGEPPPPKEAPEGVPVNAEWPIDAPAEPRRRGRRRTVSASALTAALAVEGEENPRPSFFGRTLAFGRLLLIIVFVTALAGGTFFLLATTIASKMHFHPS